MFFLGELCLDGILQPTHGIISMVGLANQMIAQNADEVLLMVAGIPILLKERHPCEG
jgi:predicted ATPase with chaperone activity